MTSALAWGKTDGVSGEIHHLAHHSADVAAVLVSLLQIPVFRARTDAAIGRPVGESEIACLGALAFLHDIGKLATGFQAKGWDGFPAVTRRDHLRCGWKWLMESDDPETALDGNAPLMARWDDALEWFRLLFAHHGRPVEHPGLGWGTDAFTPVGGYDPRSAERVMGQCLVRWFPEIVTATPPPLSPAFAHLFAGLLALADWVGSDRRAFEFVSELDEDYWTTALGKARAQLGEIGLDVRARALAGRTDWQLVSDYPTPGKAQEAVARVPATERLVILEAETGSGKTEAALWRFAKLYEAGEVDALYFAVPTRAAARQLQSRVNAAARRMFRAPAPEAILAIPGQALAGEARGFRLPDFRTRWDDTDAATPTRWAAEHATRYLAAQIAVGTVDQVMLGGLKVKHAHLRGAALSRSLVVIDEVHASDAWMTAIQRSLLTAHMALGGHVLLMSATLGSVARAAWRGEKAPCLHEAVAAPYPVVWTAAGCYPAGEVDDAQKAVSVRVECGWSGARAAEIAVDAARKGARVLTIRNTVDRARETFDACISAAPELVFSTRDRPTLHHSRFAAEDRALLDARVEQLFGKGGVGAGCVLVGTQTLEQSLDIDADLLVTDLCPMDVLLQRIGRLHRHARTRPDGFATPCVIVLCPENGLAPLTHAPENGLGAFEKSASLSGVYLDLPGLAATLEQIEAHPVWRIPAKNRALVEAATHPDALEQIARGQGWEGYRARVIGKTIAETLGAKNVVLDRTKAFPESFPDDEAVRTRLGEQGAVLTLPDAVIGPFGTPIRTIALPAHWSRGITGEDEVHVSGSGPLTITVGSRAFVYDTAGIRPMEG